MKNDHVIETAKDSSQSIVSNDEQILERFERGKRFKQLKEELNLNSKWDIIIEEEGEFYFVDAYENKYRIDLELRKKLPQSFFYHPQCDNEIVGYNPFNGSIIYDLWKIGKTEISMSEGIDSDFHDTGYGIGRLLSSEKKNGFDGKVPPTHILPPNFINFHQDLQGSLYSWHYYDISLVNDIGVRGHERLDLLNHIESCKKNFEEYGHKWTKEDQNKHNEEMERLEKNYQELFGDLNDLPF